ncbi:methyl-accepting chemotaxis protein [Dethiosulfatarculus sandiegensis]|uniref:Methyl-accepting chemotaxis protein n=1 Tax=Dethiosulfatarculus sandiegensis TaxID=1429043 RepID=A0A0D2JAV2_9BACT|nr:methyl-accepting chemotaxis protein [Dethiosulfatarculus sandiegensis]KIX15264.1 methyl-accepting chemotaxis protein [Dethiosulfatarculus sandiegensis]
MFKKLKLSSKMYGGFMAVLVLACVAVYFGFNGLTAVNSRVGKTDDVNSLVKNILTARQQEKNYIIRTDQASITGVKKSISDLKQQAALTKEEFSQKINKDQMDEVTSQGNSYLKSFEDYVKLDAEQKKLMTQMRKAGQTALAQCEDIGKDQKAQLNQTRSQAEETVNDKITKADDANRLIKILLEAKSVRITQMYDPSEKNLNKWHELNEKIFTLTKDLKSRFKYKLNIEQADAVLKTYQDYESNALAFLTSRDITHREAMLKSAVQTVKAMEAIRTDQKNQLAKVREKAELEVKDKLQKADDANRMIKWFLEARKDEKEFIISGGKAEWQQKNEEKVKAIITLAADLKGRFHNKDNKDKSDKLIAAVKNYSAAFAEYSKTNTQQAKAGQAMLVAARKAQKVCAAAWTDQKAKMVNQMEASQWSMGVAAALAVFIGLFLSVFITRSVTGPLNKVIGGLSAGSSQVAAASGQVTNASQSLAEGASEQAASLEETSSSLEEMSSMTKQNADNAEQADGMMKEAADVVTKAGISMTELKSAMESIDKASDQTAKIIKTIDEIAFQTNLLALNAAVEAARAGEAGAGFAVVADEVRSLAMRAAEAAKNTQALIEENLKNIKQGAALVKGTDEAFKQVQDQSAKVAELVGEISAASKEQAQGIDQINRAAGEMDEVTQQNAANAEESAAAAEELSAQAESMQEFVHDLTSLVGKDKTKTRPLDIKSGVLKKITTAGKRPIKKTEALPMPDDSAQFNDDFKDF